jgi:hypothetical protein
MLKILTALLLVLFLGSCYKEVRTAPPKPLPPLPDVVIANYKAFPSSDTLYATRFYNNIIGFAYRDYYGGYNNAGALSGWILDPSLLEIIREAYEKVFPDSLNLNYGLLSKYEMRLEIRRENGSLNFYRQWPLYKVKQQ